MRASIANPQVPWKNLLPGLHDARVLTSKEGGARAVAPSGPADGGAMAIHEVARCDCASRCQARQPPLKRDISRNPVGDWLSNCCVTTRTALTDHSQVFEVALAPVDSAVDHLAFRIREMKIAHVDWT